MKKVLGLLLVLVLCSVVGADNTLSFQVIDDGSKANVSDAAIKVCLDDKYVEDCQMGFTDATGYVEFLIRYDPNTAFKVVYYAVYKEGFVLVKDQVSMSKKGAHIGSIRIPFVNWNLNVPFHPETWNTEEAYEDTSRTVYLSDNLGAFTLGWSTIFPACSNERGKDVNLLRCGSEFLIPNLHLSGISSLFVMSVTSIFSLDWANPSIPVFVDWIVGVITPIFILFLLVIIEFMKTYALVSLAFLCWSYLVEELIHANIIRPQMFILLVPVVVFLMIMGSIYLLGVDSSFWGPLVVI